jgi:hypothetical protein
MKLRLRLPTGPPITRKPGKNRHLALAAGALLIPGSLMAYVLGFWRLASDMGLAPGFTVAGLFAHWQVWIALAVLLHVTASMLNRYGRSGEFQMPRFLNLRFLPFRPRPRPAGSSREAGGHGVV